MSGLVFGHDAQVCAYVMAAFPEFEGQWHNATGIGVDVGGAIRAGLVVHPLNMFDAEISLFSETPRAWTPGIARGIATYLFGHRKFRRLTFSIHPKNKRSRSLVERLGAKLEGRKRRGYDGHRNALIYGLLPEECPFYG